MSVKRKPRSRQITPSAGRRKELYRMLSQRADAGDVHAAGWLLLLTEHRETSRA